MEKLAAGKRAEVSKMSTERLRARLTKAGYDEGDVFEMERGENRNLSGDDQKRKNKISEMNYGEKKEKKIWKYKNHEMKYKEKKRRKNCNDKEKRRRKNLNDKDNEMS